MALGPPFARDSHPRSHRRHSTPFPPQTLATLTVSRRPGYRGVATAQSVATLSQLAPMRLVFRDGHSTTRSASRHLSNQLLRRRTVGTLIARWQNDDQRWYRSWSVAACVGNRRLFKTRELRSIDTSVASALASPVAILGRDSHRRRQNDLGARHAIAGQESGPKSPWDLRSSSRFVSDAGEQSETALAG